MLTNKFNHINFKDNSLAIELAKEFDFILENVSNKFLYQKGLYRWTRVVDKVEMPHKKAIGDSIRKIDGAINAKEVVLTLKNEMELYLLKLIG